jgi:hypothetical protein
MRCGSVAIPFRHHRHHPERTVVSASKWLELAGDIRVIGIQPVQGPREIARAAAGTEKVRITERTPKPRSPLAIQSGGRASVAGILPRQRPPRARRTIFSSACGSGFAIRLLLRAVQSPPFPPCAARRRGGPGGGLGGPGPAPGPRPPRPHLRKSRTLLPNPWPYKPPGDPGAPEEPPSYRSRVLQLEVADWVSFGRLQLWRPSQRPSGR